MKVRVNQKTDFHFVGKGEDLDLELPIDAAAHVGGKGRGFRPPALLMYSSRSFSMFEVLLERNDEKRAPQAQPEHPPSHPISIIGLAGVSL